MKFFINKMLNAGSEVAGEVTEAATEGGMQFGFVAGKFWKALSVMGMGMLGIFIVTGVIILSVMLLNKFTSGKKDK